MLWIDKRVSLLKLFTILRFLLQCPVERPRFRRLTRRASPASGARPSALEGESLSYGLQKQAAANHAGNSAQSDWRRAATGRTKDSRASRRCCGQSAQTARNK